MRLGRHTRTVKKVLYAPITLVALVILTVVLVRAAIGAYQNDRQNRDNYSRIQQDAMDLQTREQFLTGEIDRLQSTRGIEQELRNKFPVVKEGEDVVIIVEPEKKEASSYPGDSGGFWSKVRDFFR